MFKCEVKFIQILRIGLFIMLGVMRVQVQVQSGQM